MSFDLPAGALSEKEVGEIYAHILRLDPERKRIWINSDEDGWLIVLAGKGVMHPKSFLEMAREIE